MAGHVIPPRDWNLERLTKVFRPGTGPEIHAVSEVSLTLRAGEWLTVMGASGSGKTTLLRLLAGLEAPTSGRIVAGGEDWTTRPPARRGVALVAQTAALIEHLSVRENLELGPRLRGSGKSERRLLVEEAAQRVGLSALLDRAPDTLSGGEAQRAALARALLARPALLLLDEPFSALDGPVRFELRRLLRSLRSELQASAVFVTHDLGEARALGDRMAVLARGALLQADNPSVVEDCPSSLSVLRLVAHPPPLVVRGRLRRSTDGRLFEALDTAIGGVLVPDHALPSEPGDAALVDLAIRAEALSIPEGEPEAGWRLDLQDVEVQGGEAVLCGAIGNSACFMRVPATEVPAAGSRVPLRIDWTRAVWFSPDSGLRLAQRPAG